MDTVQHVMEFAVGGLDALNPIERGSQIRVYEAARAEAADQLRAFFNTAPAAPC